MLSKSKAFLNKTKNLNKISSKCLVSMPECSFKPEEYSGPKYEDVVRTRKENLTKGSAAYYQEPLLVHQGHKQWLWDTTGKRYLDLFAGIVTVGVGHCHPKVNAALEAQIKKLWHTTTIYCYPSIHEYTHKLLSKFPSKFNVVLYTNSGSEANDLALYLARLYTGRFDIISLRNGYHGMSPYTMGITSLSTWKYNVPTSFGIHPTMNPDVYRGVWGGKHCRDSLNQVSRDCNCSPNECQAGENYSDQVKDILLHCAPKGGKVAGFIAESIQGVGGAVQYPKNFLKKTADLVQQVGGLVISDEVQTGFGRTGTNYWGFQNHGIEPDIVTMAKSIGNGFPMAALVTTREIADCLSQASYFNTFGGNPMACAVGSAVLDVIDEEKLQENCHQVGSYFLSELNKLKEEFNIIGDVRGKGLMIGIELVQDKESKKPLPLDRVSAIFETTKQMGILVGRGGLYGNVFRIKPPMCITKQDVDFSIHVLKKAIHKESKKN